MGKNNRRREEAETSEQILKFPNLDRLRISECHDGHCGIQDDVKKMTIFLRQYHIYLGPFRHLSWAWTCLTWDEENELQISAYDKAPDGSGDGVVDMIPYPNNLHLNNGVATAAWKSKLFFISGLIPHPDNYSGIWDKCAPTVCAFDTLHQSWDTPQKYKPIQTPRYNHTAVVIGNRIYVFGGFSDIPQECWAERFDIIENKWIYLPRPPNHLCRDHEVQTHAIYYETLADSSIRPLILFPFDSTSICVFDCINEDWLPDIQPCFPPHARRKFCGLSDGFAVIDGVLIWNCGSYMWGYDFINKEYLGSLFTLPPNDPQPEGYHYYFPMRFFLHLGDQKLFVVWFYTTHDQCIVHCYQFRVQKKKCKQGTTRLRLVCEARSTFPTKSIDRSGLADVLAL